MLRTAACFVCLAFALPSWAADDEAVCGDNGVWLQILGAGGPEITDGQGGPGYLIWLDGKARVLIDAGAGASVEFDRARARIEDLEVIALTHLHTDHTVDLPAIIQGSYFESREEPLIILGPDSNNEIYPDTETFIDRLFGPQGAYSYLQDVLTYNSDSGYRLRARNVPATGKRRWARFGTENVRMAAIPVNHADVPTLAWRVEIGGKSIVVTGDFNNQKNVMPEFAKDADFLVATHAIPEIARGTQRELYALPSQLGRIAKQAEVRMLVLSHRMSRTRGRESQSREQIEENYDGYILFANDGECWGL